jgi:SSS family solute:Na+ symporter
VVASLLAALMASLAACFNSTSTLMTIDIYKKWRPAATEKQQVNFGRLATVALVVISIAWVPLVTSLSDQLYVYLQSIQGYLGPPIACVFLVGLLWPKANAKGASVVLWTGFVLGMLRFILEVVNKRHPFTNPFIHTMVTMNFMHFAILLFVFSVLLMVLISVVTPPPPQSKLNGLTFKYAGNIDLSESYKVESRQRRKQNMIASVILLVLLIVLYGIFF